MKRKPACILLLLMLIPAFGLVGLQYFDVFDFWEEIFGPQDEIVIGNVSGTVISQGSPQMIGNENGEIIIAFTSNLTGDFDIYVQKVSKLGRKMWEDGGVAICSDPDVQKRPEIISDGDGGAIILWANGTKTWPSGLYAQRINNKGELMWGASEDYSGVMISSPEYYQEYHHMVADGQGGALIVWKYYGGPGGIHAQHLNSAGDVMSGWAATGNEVVSHGSTVDAPKMCPDGQGGAFVVWEDVRGVDYDIYAQRMTSAGVAAWGDDGISICGYTTIQTNPMVISDGENGAIFAWCDRRGTLGTTIYDIYASRLDASGALKSGWVADGTPISVLESQEYSVQIYSDGNHGAYFAWSNGTLGNLDVLAQRVDGGANLLWGTQGITICNNPEGQYIYPIVADGEGNVFIPWSDYRNDLTTGQDLYGQLVSADGEILWENQGRPLVQEPDSQYFTKRVNEVLPIAVADGSGNIVMTWTDKRNLNETSYDVYIKRVPMGYPGQFEFIRIIESYYGIGILGWVVLLVLSMILMITSSNGKKKPKKRSRRR